MTLFDTWDDLPAGPERASREPYTRERCPVTHGHGLLYADDTVQVYVCPANRCVWTDPETGWTFTITFAFGHAPTFRWGMP